MTHESIKNLDWTFNNEDDEFDFTEPKINIIKSFTSNVLTSLVLRLSTFT